VEALLQIYSCFFSHSAKLYVAYRHVRPQGGKRAFTPWKLGLRTKN